MSASRIVSARSSSYAILKHAHRGMVEAGAVASPAPNVVEQGGTGTVHFGVRFNCLTPRDLFCLKIPTGSKKHPS